MSVSVRLRSGDEVAHNPHEWLETPAPYLLEACRPSSQIQVIFKQDEDKKCAPFVFCKW